MLYGTKVIHGEPDTVIKYLLTTIFHPQLWIKRTLLQNKNEYWESLLKHFNRIFSSHNGLIVIQSFNNEFVVKLWHVFKMMVKFYAHNLPIRWLSLEKLKV